MLLNLFQLALVPLVTALSCDKGDLAQYRLHEQFTQVTARSFLSDTPPSKTNMTWYLNLCNEVEYVSEECPKNSQICGVQTVLLPGEQPIKTQVISYGNGLNFEIVNANNTDLIITLDETSWGSNSISAKLELHCSAEEEDMTLDWDPESQLTVHWSTPGACLKSDKDVPPPKKGKDDKKAPDDKPDDSWGWFTWLFIIFVLAVGGYIILGAWVTYSKSPADLQDAVHDFADTLKNLFGALPGFISEIMQKVFGSNNRGGYSAV